METLLSSHHHHVDLRTQVGALELSDLGVTTYQPVMPGTRKYLFSRLLNHARLSHMLLLLADFLPLLSLKSFKSF